MQTFNDSEFSLVGNDGVRMFFDMKGSGSLTLRSQTVKPMICFAGKWEYDLTTMFRQIL